MGGERGQRVAAILERTRAARLELDEIIAGIARRDGVPSEAYVTLAEIERAHIERTLAGASGNVSEAARRLGIYRSSLQRRLRRYNAPRHADQEMRGSLEVARDTQSKHRCA